jgi:hypothetical protein
MGKSVLKQLRFELRFDDPQIPEEQRITIRGNHDQLEVLHTTVANYVQELLQKSPDNFWISFAQPTESAKVSDAAQLKDLDDSSNVQANTTNSFSTQMLDTEIKIQPARPLNHNLFLGSLANQASGPVISLSLLQLFDLATALDEYSADVLSLPNLNTNSSDTAFPAWAPVAAVLVLAAGLTPVTWQYAQSIRQKQQTAAKSHQAQEKIAIAPSPAPLVNSPTPLPLLTPPDSLLSQSQSPLPLVGSAVPPPPPITQTPPSSLSTTSLNSQKINLPPGSETFPDLSVPKTSTSSSGGLATLPGTTSQTFSSLKKTPPLSSQKQQISLQPNLKPNGTGLTSNDGLPLPQSSLATSKLPGKTSPYSNLAKVPPSLGTLPHSSSTGISSIPGNLPPDVSSPTGSQNSLVTKLRGTNQKRATEVATGTLFDTAQVAEARDYFKKHWRPPTELKQTIQYSLVVGVDGTIEQIMPLGKAARDFVDRSGIPLIGEHFVSPNKNGQAVRIRAVLSPDGKVQTFPENE